MPLASSARQIAKGQAASVVCFADEFIALSSYVEQQFTAF